MSCGASGALKQCHPPDFTLCRLPPAFLGDAPNFLGNFGAFKAVAVGAGASRLSAELASGYREGGGAGMGLAEAVRLAARVLEGERRREINAQDRSAAGGSKFRGIGMEIATIAVAREEEEEAGAGAGAGVSAYLYDDAEVEKVLSTLDGWKDKEAGAAGGEGGRDGSGGGSGSGGGR